MPTLAAPKQQSGLWESARRIEGRHSLSDIREWLSSRRQQNRFRVERVPLEDLQEWQFDASGNLVHRTGKFFRVEGLQARIKHAPVPSWEQPILVQPEVGILGFLACRLDGILHFLVQAKMEPGNVNLVQLSPTVQATHSNYSQAHGGARPRYVDYFLPGSKADAICDQLHSEQGTRFLRKQNRNVVVEIPATEAPAVHDDFCWMTLGQLGLLLREDNVVNMDSRSVLGCLPLHAQSPVSGGGSSGLGDDVQLSLTTADASAVHTTAELSQWFETHRAQMLVQQGQVPLGSLTHWALRDGVIAHSSGRYFSVVGVSVEASSREVGAWKQPLVQSAAGGVLAFAFARIRGVLHFLVQARAEAGLRMGTEMAPTLQFTPGNYCHLPRDLWPRFHELVGGQDGRYVLDVAQSEEGGRFYGDVRRNILIEVEPHIELPPRYIWMTLGQLKVFIAMGGYVNIEARTLLAGIQGLMARTA